MTPQILFLAAALAMGASDRQQPAPTAPTPSSSTSERTPAPAFPAKVTVEGCVATEAEIPNRKTDLGERTGLDKHFVLTNGALVKGKAPVAAPAAGSAVAATPLAPLFQLHGLTDEQLKLHVGHRVRVEGRFITPEPSTTASSSGDDDLVKLDVATIRQVPGDCSVPKS